MNVCKRVHYSGHVQGVGFRYTAARIATQHPVVGYVKNLSDGRVELVAQGVPEEVERFLQHMSRTMAEYIESQRVDEMAVQGFQTFDIRV